MGLRRRVLLTSVALCAAACGPTTSGQGGGPSGPPSVVVLGDSVASGEGIAYGYTYDSTSQTLHWAGGTPNPQWLPPYPACHVTSEAYGDVVAKALKGSLSNFACTGSTYPNGVAGPRVDNGVTFRPPQFGDWTTRSGLNAFYDAAKPDIVLVTLGADDVHFVSIVEACVAASVLDPTECTAANPGATIRSDYFSELPALRSDYQSLVSAIKSRGSAAHKVPFIVFTTYPDPLPAPGADISITRCPDAAHLSGAQISYLESLVSGLNNLIQQSVANLSGVAVADVGDAFAGHQFCSPDPWAYGPSVLLVDPASTAPFHPTPRGQQAIADRVLSVVPARYKP